MSTIYELSWGAGNEGGKRYFPAFEHTDAAVRMSERILELDGDASISAAWVHLKRLPDSIYPEGMTLVGWTKTSDERPTSEGSLTPE